MEIILTLVTNPQQLLADITQIGTQSSSNCVLITSAHYCRRWIFNTSRRRNDVTITGNDNLLDVTNEPRQIIHSLAQVLWCLAVIIVTPPQLGNEFRNLEQLVYRDSAVIKRMN
jgi:hypothetical protein